MESGWLETVKVVLEILALVFLPIVAWLLKTVVSHNRKIDILEDKVNAEIRRRLDTMERKIDTFDNKIETKIDRLEQNLNSKIDVMTSVLTNCANSLLGPKEK
jgi:predicted PurR-regulated permease PerM